MFGVELGTDLMAHHIAVEKENDLYRFRNSKYVQSSVGGGTHRQIKSFLEQGRFVCFSGTPCQIEGLKNFLKKDYDNLITVDVVCRAVPSPCIIFFFLLKPDYFSFLGIFTILYNYTSNTLAIRQSYDYFIEKCC